MHEQLCYIRRLKRYMMRYYTEEPPIYRNICGKTYHCDHPLYNRCTLFVAKGKGLAVIQQRFDPATKRTWWDEIDPWIPNPIYLHPKFLPYFLERADVCKEGLYPTVSVRQIMWALKMKPIKRQRWETVFDRRDI